MLSTYILCNFFQFKLKLWVPIPIRWGVLGTTLCDKVCQWLAEGRWFSPGPPVSATNKTNGHDITEILLKVALSILTLVQINKQQDLCELIKKRQHAVCHTEQVLTKWKHIKQFRYLIFLQFVWKDNKHLLLFAWHIYKETIYIYEFESCPGKVHSMQHHVIKFNKISTKLFVLWPQLQVQFFSSWT